MHDGCYCESSTSRRSGRGLIAVSGRSDSFLESALIAALRQGSGGYDGALRVLAGLMLMSTVIPAVLRKTP
jgi:hypothetical protein